MSAAKHTPWWHPRYVFAGELAYSEMDRKDAAGMLRDHRRAKTIHSTRGSHGQRIYVLHTPGGMYESGRIHLSKATGAAT